MPIQLPVHQVRQDRFEPTCQNSLAPRVKGAAFGALILGGSAALGMHCGNTPDLAISTFFAGGVATAAAQKLRGQSHHECIVSSLVTAGASTGMAMAGAAGHGLGLGLGLVVLAAALGGYAGYMATDTKSNG